LQADRKLTVLLVSHQPEDALYAATRTAFVYDGQVLQVGATRDLLDGGAGSELRAYLGEFALRGG
jgi:thiamine transport system ATP-binding protein